MAFSASPPPPSAIAAWTTTRPLAATTTPAPPVWRAWSGPGSALALGITTEATANVSGSALDYGQAMGGAGNTASGTGALFAGLGAGGGIFNFLGNYNDPVFGQQNASTVSVSTSTLENNVAQGGGGGNGEGGGIANLGVLGMLSNTPSATTTVDSSTLTQNQAIGDGSGSGLGGGLYNDAVSTLALTLTLVTQNQANGSTGIGGGIYNAVGGTMTADMYTVIADNLASTGGDDIGP